MCGTIILCCLFSAIWWSGPPVKLPFFFFLLIEADMNTIEALRLQVDNLQLEVQSLKTEDAKFYKENPALASEINDQNRVLTKLEGAHKEITELCQRLHEAQEEQALCEDKLVSLIINNVVRRILNWRNRS